MFLAAALLAAARIAGAAVCGDADGDGLVAVRDGVRILRNAAGLDEPCIEAGCDVDRDGHVTTTDGVLALRRTADLPIVDHCGTGTITGRLLVPPTDAAALAEREPNDGPGTAGVAGVLAPGGTRRLTGAIGADDPFDAWTFIAASSLALDLTLEIAPTPDADLDLLIDDRRGGSLTCESTEPNVERCRVLFGTHAPAAVDVVVAPAEGSGPATYTLRVDAAAAATTTEGVTADAGADAPLALEPAVYRGEVPAIVAGEIVAELSAARTTQPADERSTRRAVAAAALAAGIDDALTVDVTAPDGTVLLTMPGPPGTSMRATSGPYGLEAKATRAALRARTRAVATALAASSGVREARPNGLVRPAAVPNDPRYPEQWHCDVIGLPDAWDTTVGADATIVAVVDTGVRSDHPDLARRLVPGFDFITSPARANDGDGIDPDPFDPGDRPQTPPGGSYHGTHVTGTIAATTDNGRGVAGVTWRTSIMPLRVLGIGGGSIFDVAQAIRYAAGLPNMSGTIPPTPARIVNLSLTTSGEDPFLRDAVDAATDAGVLVVAAAGNGGGNAVQSPGSFPNVVSVGATERLGERARYSSFGPTLDLAAPGGDTHRDRDGDDRPDGVLSTHVPGGDDYGVLQGTSMAAAHVSGVAALLLDVPGAVRISAAEVHTILVATAADRGAPGRDDEYGAGIVDAAAAVRARTGASPPPGTRLVLESPGIHVAADESAPRVPFRNAGADALVIAGVVTETDDGVPWLAPTIEGNAVRVGVDRTALAAGTHDGRVTIGSNGGTVELGVRLDVAAGPPADLGPVTVFLRDAATTAIVATAGTSAGMDYRYRFDAVPAGDYRIEATTDRDGDGKVCDLGESCGAYPERTMPTVVTLFGGAEIDARDFGLTLILSASDGAP